MALRSVKRHRNYYTDDSHGLNYVKNNSGNCNSSLDRQGKSKNFESRKKQKEGKSKNFESRKKQKEEKLQQKPKRRSGFDVKPPKQVLELKNKAAADDDEEFIEITLDENSVYNNKEPADCNDEELIHSYCEGLLFGKIDRETALKEAPALRNYIIQIEASEGFDVDVWPNLACLPMSAIFPAIRSPKHDEHYMMLATFAIEHYNKNNGTNFQADRLVKLYSAPRDYYYMTFEVKNPSQTFQAKVSQAHVSVCRPKPHVV